jgi:hypothetical protein
VNDGACDDPQTDLCNGKCSIGMNPCTTDVQCDDPQTDECKGRCALGENLCVNNSVCVVAAGDRLKWQPPPSLGGLSVTYDTLRSLFADDFTSSTTCVEWDQLDLVTLEPTNPPAGQVRFYLIRVENTCPASPGNMGTDSEGTVRTGQSCP